MLSNYPPGVTGMEPEIAGYDFAEEAEVSLNRAMASMVEVEYQLHDIQHGRWDFDSQLSIDFENIDGSYEDIEHLESEARSLYESAIALYKALEDVLDYTDRAKVALEECEEGQDDGN